MPGRAPRLCDLPSLPRSSFPQQQPRRRDGRVAEGARLESVFTRKGNVGSNPTLSASFQITAKHAGSVSLLLFLPGSCY